MAASPGIEGPHARLETSGRFAGNAHPCCFRVRTRYSYALVRAAYERGSTDITQRCVVIRHLHAISPGPPGAITGKSLMYPADAMPALAIYALSTTYPHRFFYVRTQPGQLSYKISNVAPGTYDVIAYLAHGLDPNATFKVLSGGYTQEVPCALAGGITCDDHTLIQVSVLPGVTITNVNPNDWYGGVYPPRPGP